MGSCSKLAFAACLYPPVREFCAYFIWPAVSNIPLLGQLADTTSRVLIVLHRRTSAREVSMKISARNRLKGKIIEVTKGATTAHIRIEIAGGAVVTASITNESVDELGLAVGGEAYAVVKSSDVMVAVD
jgi:molybdopterin-binding protein